VEHFRKATPAISLADSWVVRIMGNALVGTLESLRLAAGLSTPIFFGGLGQLPTTLDDGHFTDPAYKAYHEILTKLNTWLSVQVSERGGSLTAMVDVTSV